MTGHGALGLEIRKSEPGAIFKAKELRDCLENFLLNAFFKSILY